jgi:predicted N-acetyltransferase YhbS
MYQKQGIGKQLIIKAHEKARELGYQSVVLLGHQDYYPRFGYERASKYAITLPFEVPDENCMIIELISRGLQGVQGKVEYPLEFFD